MANQFRILSFTSDALHKNETNQNKDRKHKNGKSKDETKIANGLKNTDQINIKALKTTQMLNKHSLTNNISDT